MSDPDSTDWVIGCNLTVQTKNEKIQGEVFAYDKGSNTVLIRQQGSTPFHSNLRLLKISYIKVSQVPALATLQCFAQLCAAEAVCCAIFTAAMFSHTCRLSVMCLLLLAQWTLFHSWTCKGAETESPRPYRSG